jgi:hypothetical protein
MKKIFTSTCFGAIITSPCRHEGEYESFPCYQYFRQNGVKDKKFRSFQFPNLQFRFYSPARDDIPVGQNLPLNPSAVGTKYYIILLLISSF